MIVQSLDLTWVAHIPGDFFQQMSQTYRHAARCHGWKVMVKFIESISNGPIELVEIIRMGRVLKKRVDDVLVYLATTSPSSQ